MDEGDSCRRTVPYSRYALLAATVLLALQGFSCSPSATRRGGETVLSSARHPAGEAEPGPVPSLPPSVPPPSPPSAPPSEGVVPPLAMPPVAPAPAMPSAVEEPADPQARLELETPVDAPRDGGEVREAREEPPRGKGTEAAGTKGEPDAGKGASPVIPSSRNGAEHVGRGKGEGPKEEPGKGKSSLRKTPATVPSAPGWEREDLSFQVRYLGVPCGYARFTSLGRVMIGGREAVHLKVRGWTSKLLSIVYPLDTTMDYYLDPSTGLPLRIDQRKTERGRYKASIALYDQQNGVITYWTPDTKKMTKRVRTVPSVHDPVSVVYNIRTLDPDASQSPRYVYAGRKIWQVQPRRIGAEKVPDEHGRNVDTVVLAPLIRREGQVESKGDIRVWISRDARHAPLRIYAGIKLGTVEGRLIPSPTGGS